jgi:hypothetical protein
VLSQGAKQNSRVEAEKRALRRGRIRHKSHHQFDSEIGERNAAGSPENGEHGALRHELAKDSAARSSDGELRGNTSEARRGSGHQQASYLVVEIFGLPRPELDVEW